MFKFQYNKPPPRMTRSDYQLFNVQRQCDVIIAAEKDEAEKITVKEC